MGVTKRVLGLEFKSLQYFLNRAAVLTQYREFLRITKSLPVDVRLDVRCQIRTGFDACRNEKDEQRVALLLQQARNQMKMVSDLVDTAVAQQRSATSKRDWKQDVVTKRTATALTGTSGTGMDALSEDKGGKEDVKGRLGAGWPWQSGRRTDLLDLEGIKRR